MPTVISQRYRKKEHSNKAYDYKIIKNKQRETVHTQMWLGIIHTIWCYNLGKRYCKFKMYAN